MAFCISSTANYATKLAIARDMEQVECVVLVTNMQHVQISYLVK